MHNTDLNIIVSMSLCDSCAKSKFRHKAIKSNLIITETNSVALGSIE